MFLDGSNPFVLYNKTDLFITTVVPDYDENNVYWLEQDFLEHVIRIRHVNLDGGDAKTWKVAGNFNYEYNLYNLGVDKNYLYFVTNSIQNKTSGQILRAGKGDGVIDTNFEIQENEINANNMQNMLENTLVLSQSHDIVEGHPCKKDNGGCQDFCFAVPDETRKLTKKCSDAKKLTALENLAVSSLVTPLNVLADAPAGSSHLTCGYAYTIAILISLSKIRVQF